MSAAEKVEALLAEVLPRIEELEAEALARIAEVERDARAKIARVGAAREELIGIEGEVDSMRLDREEIPEKAYRAGLDGEYQLEDELKERYQNLKPAVEACEARRAELEAEISSLVPRSGREPHPLDPEIRHTARVARAAFEERGPLEHLRDRLTKAANSAADSVVKAHEENRAEVEAMNRTVEFQQSPVGKGGDQVVIEQTPEQRADNLRAAADELDRRADAIPASEAYERTAEAENLRAAAGRARAEAERLEGGDPGA